MRSITCTDFVVGGHHQPPLTITTITTTTITIVIMQYHRNHLAISLLFIMIIIVIIIIIIIIYIVTAVIRNNGFCHSYTGLPRIIHPSHDNRWWEEPQTLGTSCRRWATTSGIVWGGVSYVPFIILHNIVLDFDSPFIHID
jgi:hypothetical protein